MNRDGDDTVPKATQAAVVAPSKLPTAVTNISA